MSILSETFADFATISRNDALPLAELTGAVNERFVSLSMSRGSLPKLTFTVLLNLTLVSLNGSIVLEVLIRG